MRENHPVFSLKYVFLGSTILDIVGKSYNQVTLTSINWTIQSIVVIGIAFAHPNSSLKYKMKFPFAVAMSMTVWIVFAGIN